VPRRTDLAWFFRRQNVDQASVLIMVSIFVFEQARTVITRLRMTANSFNQQTD
jgi:hypothetical protein